MNQTDYLKEWKKQNMKQISVSYRKEFVEEFKQALSTLGLKQSDVFRIAMQNVIDEARKKESKL